MRLAHRFPRLRRGTQILAFFALLGLTAVGLSQCKAVQDNLTGVSASLAKNGPGNCISACAKQYADLNRAEAELHATNVQACSGDPVCEALEEARHEEAIQSIVDGTWKGGRNETYGLADDGVGLGKTSPDVPPAATEAADTAKQQIADGEISDIPTTVP